MKRVCAWCNKEMTPAKAGGKTSVNMQTHSICNDCSDNLDFQLGVPLSTYLDSFKIPVVALDGNNAIIGVNKAAAETYRDKVVIESAEWQEKVFECAHARLPQGCKKAVHCSGCAIRIVTHESFTSGKSSYDIPAHVDHCSADSSEKAELLISAERTDNIVFLKITRYCQK